MSDMTAILTRKCIHFTGLMDQRCKAGVEYKTFREPGKPLLLPCIKTGGHCDKCQYPTVEEAEAREKELLNDALNGIAMYALAKEHFKKTGQMSATIQCVCGGKMTYAVASSNNHIRAKCPSCGQSFIE